MDGLFLIHTYNELQQHLLDKCKELGYGLCIFDASDDPRKAQKIEKQAPGCVRQVPNTGHNITSYFAYFAEEIEKGTLPEVLCLLKGNMLGRHCSEEYFDRVIGNTFFTYLYEEKAMRERYSKATPETLARNGGKDPSAGSIALLLTQSRYIEENNSWYMHQDTHTARYFDEFDDFLRFVYKDPVIPKYVSFSPGACYIVRREQVEMHSAAFYRNLNRLQNYTLQPGFPAEAYLIERLLPVIFEEHYEENPWMSDEKAFGQKIEEAAGALEEKRKALQNRSFFDKVKGRLQRR